MLSRHFLRSKVLQALYAARVEEMDDSQVLHNFDYHISRLNELGIIQLAIIPRLLEVGDRVFEEGKKKYRPTASDKQPNRKFLNNIFLRRMADNFELRQYSERWAGVWQTNEDLIRETFLELRQSKLYGDYLSFPQNDFKTDKEFAVNLFRYLMNREALVAAVTGRSLLWEDDFEQIAQYNFMMLKTLDEEHFDEAMVWPLMYDSKIEKDEADFRFARNLLEASLQCRQESNDLIKARLQGWEFERVALMDILLINMAVAEFITCPTIPEKVTIDEYIELSKEFSSERSRLFINGILEKLILDLRSQGRIKKTGRGLMEPEAE